ncbi:MAG TPA: hypothetical protein ENJ82_08955, partial [Bacteroidetes bacterium]|nr:hypothetical protein [Bacteroidota bacterium]
MKRTFGYLLFAFALISGLALLRPTSNTLETTFLPESDGPGNPGFYEQWHLMRQNEAGIVPANYLQTAREQDAARAASGKTVVSPLSNIAELGPVNVGGRTRAMVIDLNDHNHFIAGGISGGLWSSTDQGGTWTSINDQAQSLAVTSLSQDPQHPSDIYFSTGEVRGNSAGIGGDGLYKSTDGGSTFSQLPSTASNSHFNRTWRIQCAPNQAGVVYVATRSGGLYRTKDSGATFSQVFAPFSTTEVSDVEVFADSSVLIGVRTQGIYYSANGDAGTFSQVTSNLPTTGFRRVEIDYCDSFPAIVYAVYEASNGSEALGAWKSTDQGQTWNATGANPENTISYRFPWYCLLLSVKPDDPDFVISGGAQLGYTTDGGQNWSFAGPSHADYHNAVYDLDNPGIVYIGNDGGIYRYSSTSMFFAGLDRNATYNVTQFYTGAYFPNDAIIGGTQDNGTWRSQAGAASFRKVSGGDGAFCAVNQQDPDYSFVSYQRGIIRRSSNSQAFIPGYSTILNQLDNDNDGSVDEGAYFINPFVINLAEGNQVYFTTRDRIWRTTDSGDNWAP